MADLSMWTAAPDRLPPKTLAAMLRDGDAMKHVSVIDVRSDEDYLNVHIRSARNIESFAFEEENIVDALVRELSAAGIEHVIFHCSFCQVRGPACARYFLERMEQALAPEDPRFRVSILDGGFNKFAQTFRGQADLFEFL